jgi:hypothetical protein
MPSKSKKNRGLRKRHMTRRKRQRGSGKSKPPSKSVSEMPWKSVLPMLRVSGSARSRKSVSAMSRKSVLPMLRVSARPGKSARRSKSVSRRLRVPGLGLGPIIPKPTSIPKTSKYLLLNTDDTVHERRFLETLQKELMTKTAIHPYSRGPPLNCSIYLIKVKAGAGAFKYYIYDSETKKYAEDTQVLSELPKLEAQLKHTDGGEKRCQGTINTEFITGAYDSNDISIILFSINRSVKPLEDRTNPYSLCGLVLLQNKENNGMYLTLICSLQKVGGYLLSLAENISRHFNKTHLFLKSLADPMPIYIHKKYKFIKGSDTFYYKDLPIEFKSDPDREIQRHSKYYEDWWGFLYNMETIVKSHRLKMSKTGRKRNVISGIKGNDDYGWHMFKEL